MIYLPILILMYVFLAILYTGVLIPILLPLFVAYIVLKHVYSLLKYVNPDREEIKYWLTLILACMIISLISGYFVSEFTYQHLNEIAVKFIKS